MFPPVPDDNEGARREMATAARRVRTVVVWLLLFALTFVAVSLIRMLLLAVFT